MDPVEVWAAIGVVCIPLGIIITWQQFQISSLKAENKVCTKAQVLQQAEMDVLRKTQTDMLLRLVASEDARRSAEHDMNDAKQESANLRALDDVRQGRRPRGPK